MYYIFVCVTSCTTTVAGATLLAAGSSSPELFTAVVGAIFFASDNPGPATNIGSAVFNQCVIIGCTALVLPSATGTLLQTKAFVRDASFYAIALVILYTFYMKVSPGEVEMWEALVLASVWIVYIVVVVKLDTGLDAPSLSALPSRENRKHSSLMSPVPSSPPPSTTTAAAASKGGRVDSSTNALVYESAREGYRSRWGGGSADEKVQVDADTEVAEAFSILSEQEATAAAAGASALAAGGGGGGNRHAAPTSLVGKIVHVVGMPFESIFR